MESNNYNTILAHYMAVLYFNDEVKVTFNACYLHFDVCGDTLFLLLLVMGTQ